MADWVEEMIEREAIPRSLREGTVEDFANKWGIDPSTYYYQSRKKENQKKVLDIALSLAKKGIPEVLEKLREKAESGDMKATEMYLNYVLELKNKVDITTNDKEINSITAINYITPDGNNIKTNDKAE